MKNPFSSDVPEEKKLVRNVFDLGRSSVFTTEFGQLYPFFLQEVIPGDSVQLDAQVGLRGMPTLFPLQTKMRCSIEFYYVRNRTLYKDWEDFIYKTKDVEAPWLKLNNERAKQMISTGSLGDALGVPTSAARGNVKDVVPLDFRQTSYLYKTVTNYTPKQALQHLKDNNLSILTNETGDDIVFPSPVDTWSKCFGWRTGLFEAPLEDSFNIVSNIYESAAPNFDLSAYAVFTDENDIVLSDPIEILMSGTRKTDTKMSLVISNPLDVSWYALSLSILAFHSKYRLYIVSSSIQHQQGSYSFYFPSPSNPSYNIPASFNDMIKLDDVIDATDDLYINHNPFVGANPSIKISSLPFRAYEQCMNYYYRNDKNNPYVIDNQVQYNEFIPTHDGGADENVYDFHYRNWELDRFTSAVPSPQFGEAPLVGLTYNPSKGTATLKLEGSSVTDAEGVVTQTDPEITVGVDDDGKLDSIIDFSKDVPSANLRKLQEQMQSNTGISINDLRVTNSFQRFLENTMRRGLRYRNQLKSHHHVSVDYPDIDVPQYIGGASGIVDTGQVTNMSQTGDVGLGDYIGTLAGGVSLKHKIQQYCVEHGWIIGIVSVCPLPSYPQSINKSLIKTNPFDYYLPEFGKIGYVPIHYSELMPLQTGSEQSVDDIFGYQKAWYDYMQAFDEVHGDFRISLKDFVLTRTFAERPQLSESFTVIDPEQMNDVFLANNIATPYGSTARWMCRSNVSCIMKRQIPMIGTPSLE